MVWLGCIHIKMKTQYQKWHVNSGFWGYTTQDAPYVCIARFGTIYTI